MSPKIDDIELLARIAGQSRLRQRLGRCIRLRGNAPCTSCRDACPRSLPFTTLDTILDTRGSEECIQCGACAAACPTEALYLSGGRYALWLREIRDALAAVALDSETLSLMVSCSAADAAESHMNVGCLRAWDPSMVLYAWAHGALEVELHSGDCANCIAGGTAAVEDWVDRLNAIGEVMVPSRRVVSSSAGTAADVAGKMAAIDSTSDRRGFLTSARFAASEAIRSLMSDKLETEQTTPEDETGAGEGSARREVAVAALRLLMTDSSAEDAQLTDEQRADMGAVGVLATAGPKADKSACNLCGDCARFCPTGALAISERDGSLRLSLSTARCVGCGLCVELCQSNALSMHDRGLAAITRGKRLILVRREAALCKRCGEPFGRVDTTETEEGKCEQLLCPVCQRSAERFSGFY